MKLYQVKDIQEGEQAVAIWQYNDRLWATTIRKHNGVIEDYNDDAEKWAALSFSIERKFLSISKPQCISVELI